MKILLVISLFFLISSCSFQSSQYNFLKNLVINNDNLDEPKKNWSLILENKEIYLYAINYEDQIIFANKHINIFFKNNQIIKVTGLFDDIDEIEIISNNDSLSYIADNTELSTDICDSEMISYTQAKNKKYIKICYEESSKISYENQVIVSHSGLLVGVKFKVRPDYPIIELRVKQNL